MSVSQKNKLDVAELIDKFQKEREKWRGVIDEFSGLYDDMSTIVDLQVQLYSDMGYIADYKTLLQTKFNQKEIKIKRMRADAIKKYSNDGYRYTAKEKESLVEGDIGKEVYLSSLYSSQISFYDDIYHILNNISFSIKYRIELENHRTPRM